MESTGDIVDGVVIKVTKSEVMLDIGYRKKATLPLSEATGVAFDAREIFSVGDEVEAVIIEEGDQTLTVSQHRLAELRATEGKRSVTLKRVRQELTSARRQAEQSRRQHAQDAETANRLREQLERKGREFSDLEGQLRSLGQINDDLRASIESSRTELAETRSLARKLWAAMPAEGRLRYFEHPQAWLPEWIVEQDST